MARSFPFFTSAEPAPDPERGAFLRSRAVPAAQNLPTPQPRSGDTGEAARLAGEVEWLAWDKTEVHLPAWRDLATRATQPNVFLEPAFALTAIRQEPALRRPSFLLVWDDSAHERLIGLFPVHLSVRGQDSIATCWMHEQAAIGGGLLDKARCAEALEALLAWMEIHQPHLCGLTFPSVPLDDFLTPLLGEPTRRTGAIRIVEGSERTILAGAAGRAVRPLAADMSDASVQDAGAIRSALEDFLALDAREATGTRTALIDQAAQTTFARAATRLLAREGKCRIERLVSMGQTVAAAILLRSGGTTFFWKLAFVRAASAQIGTRNFLTNILLEEARRGSRTVFCCDLPEAIDPDTTPLAGLLVADVIVAPPNRRPQELVAAMQREKRRRFARTLGQHLFQITGGRGNR